MAVTSISELVGFSERVIINLDFADVSAVMKDAGRAHMGLGVASGREKAEQAAMAAVASPLLETSINGATGVLVNVTGSAELTLDDVETAAGIVQEAANPDANIIFGATYSDEFEDEMRVTVIATGFDQKPSAIKAAAESGAAASKADANNDMDEDIFALFNKR
jgi:cell division protein FtsZ